MRLGFLRTEGGGVGEGRVVGNRFCARGRYSRVKAADVRKSEGNNGGRGEVRFCLIFFFGTRQNGSCVDSYSSARTIIFGSIYLVLSVCFELDFRFPFTSHFSFCRLEKASVWDGDCGGGEHRINIT
jgi:hypothetical protein